MSTLTQKTNSHKKFDKQNKLALNNLSINNQTDYLLLKKKLIKNSLFIFSKENYIRNFCLYITTNNIFLLFINIIVLTSSFFLILETLDDKKIQQISTVFGLVFWLIYIVEFLLKITAFGFCLGENTYLTDAWNVLDLLIILSGAVSFVPQVEDNLYFLRVMKIVRPLKALTAFSNMKRFISSLLLSLMDLFIVFIILLFFLIFFALIGQSLWSDIFDYRCRTSLLPVNGTLPLDNQFSRLCGGNDLCNENELYCLSSKDLWKDKIYFFNENDKFENFNDELYTEELNYGFTNFRNFFNSLYIVFQATTMEGWSNLMFIVMSAHNSVLATIYFTSLIILNNYFMLNLLVAILLFNFEKNYQDTIKEDNFGSRFNPPLIGGAKKLENEENLKGKLTKKNIDFSNNTNNNFNNSNNINFSNLNSVNLKLNDLNDEESNNIYNNTFAIDNKIYFNNINNNENLNNSNFFKNKIKEVKSSMDNKIHSKKNFVENKNVSCTRIGSNLSETALNDNSAIKNNKENTSYFSEKIKEDNSKIDDKTLKWSFNDVSFDIKTKMNNKLKLKNSSENFSSTKLKSNKSSLDPISPDSARGLLNNQNEIIQGDEIKFSLNKDINKAQISVEDVLFYEKIDLINLHGLNDNIKSKKHSEEVKINNENKSELSTDSFKIRKSNEVDSNNEIRHQTKNQIAIEKRQMDPKPNAKVPIPKERNIDLSYLNNSPNNIANKKISEKNFNSKNKNTQNLFQTDNSSNFHNANTIDKKDNHNLANNSNSYVKSNSFNKNINQISEFTVLDKNASSNNLLKKINIDSITTNKIEKSFNSFQKQNNFESQNFKSNIFNSSNNFNIQRISDTQLYLNKKKQILSNQLNSNEIRKTGSLSLLNLNNVSNRISNLNLLNNNNTNITSNYFINSKNNTNNYNANSNQKHFDNKLSGKDYENLLKKYRKKYVKIKKIGKQKFDILKPHTSFVKLIKEIPFFINFRKTSAYHKSNNFAFYCYYIINQPIVQYFIYFCIVFNFIILVIERKDQSDWEVNLIETLNKILVSVFILEYFLFLFAIGFRNFFKDLSNTIDFLLVVFSVLELIVINNQVNNSEISDKADIASLNMMNNYNKNNTSVTSSFKILRILRILKLIRSWHSFRIMILSIADTLKRMGNYFILLIIFIYIYALVGCNIFKDSLRFNKDTNKYDKNGEELYDNFDSFSSSYLNVFYLIIGDGWYSMFFDCLRSDANNFFVTIVYFISVILIGQLCMLNIFLAFLIDNFKISRQELFKNIEVKEKIFSNFPKISYERHRREVIKFHQKNRFRSPFLALVNFFAGQHEKKSGLNVILKSKINFEAKIKIDFKKDGKSNKSYFRRHRGNDKNSNEDKENQINKFDKMEDFEILYKNEAFYFNAKKDLLIDFEFIINLEMWKKNKLIDLFNNKLDEESASENSKYNDLLGKNDNKDKNMVGAKDANLVAIGQCGIIRNKTQISSIGIIDNIISNLSLNNKSRLSFSAKNRINKGKTVKVDFNNKFNLFKQNNVDISFNKLNDENEKINENSSKKFFEYLKEKNELDIQVSEQSNKNSIKAKNKENEFYGESKNSKLKEFESQGILKLNNDSDDEENTINYNKFNFRGENIFRKLQEKRDVGNDKELKASKQQNREEFIEKKFLVPLKNFLKKYDFIQTEEERFSRNIHQFSYSNRFNSNDQNNKNKSNMNFNQNNNEIINELNCENDMIIDEIGMKSEIDFSFQSDKNKYSLSNDNWELNNEISDENLNDLTIKKYEIKQNLSQVDLNERIRSANSKEEKFVEKTKKLELRKIKSFNINSNSKLTNIDSVENYFKELDYKHNKYLPIDENQNILFLNNKNNDEDFENKFIFDTISNMQNKVKINGDQVFLRPRNVSNSTNNFKKTKNFIFDNLEFFKKENLNKIISKEKRLSYKKARSSRFVIEDLSIFQKEKIKINSVTTKNYEFDPIMIRNASDLHDKNNNLKNELTLSSTMKNNKHKNLKMNMQEKKSNEDFNFALDEDSMLSEQKEDYSFDSILCYDFNKLNKTKNLLNLKNNNEYIHNDKFQNSYDSLSFGNDSFKLNEIDKIGPMKANIQKLNDTNNNFIKNLYSQKLNQLNLNNNNENAKPYHFKDNPDSSNSSESESLNSNSYENSKNKNSKFSIENLKDPDFIQDNKVEFNQLLFDCLKNLSQTDNRINENVNEVIQIDFNQNLEKEEFINFDVIIRKCNRNACRKSICKNIVESFFLKNVFNLNMAFKQDYYLNNAKLAESFNDLFIVKKEIVEINEIIKGIKDSNNKMQIRSLMKTSKSDSDLPQINPKQSALRVNKLKMFDFQITNEICNIKKSLFAGENEPETQNENKSRNEYKDKNKQIIEKNEDIINENNTCSKDNYIENIKNRFRKNKSLILTSNNFLAINFISEANNSDSNKNLLNNEAYKKANFSNKVKSIHFKKDQECLNNLYSDQEENKQAKINDDNIIIDTYQCKNKENKSIASFKNESKSIKENSMEESLSDTSSFIYENEEIYLLDLIPSEKNNLLSELRKREFTFDIENEVIYNDENTNKNNNLFIKVKDLFYKVSLKPFFTEFKYEIKIVRDRMSIFNLINSDKKKELLNYEILAKEINQTIQKSDEAVIRKTLSEYTEEKEQNKLNKLNEILLTNNSSSTTKHKFPYLFIKNANIENFIKEKFLRIFFIFNAKSWEIDDTNLHNKLKRESKTKNFMEKIKTKIKKRHQLQMELMKNCFYKLYLRIKNHILNSSVGIFHKELKLRNLIAKIVLSNYFEFAIMIFILLNCVFLILDNPWNDPEGWVAKSIMYSNTIFTFIFMAESFMKIIAFGLIYGQKDISQNKVANSSFPMEFIRDRRKNIFNREIDKNDKGEIRDSKIRKKSTRRVCIRGLNDNEKLNNNNDLLKKLTGFEIIREKRRRSNFSKDSQISRRAAKTVFSKAQDQVCQNDNRDNYLENQSIVDVKNNAASNSISKRGLTLKANSERNIHFDNKKLGVDKKSLTSFLKLSKTKTENSAKNDRKSPKSLKSLTKQRTSGTIITKKKTTANLSIKKQTDLGLVQLNKEININTNIETNNSNLSTNAKNKINQNSNLFSLREINFSNYSGYLNNFSNLIDFIVIILGFIDVISTDDIAAAKYLRTMRMLRSIRPIRLITKNENLKLILTCLIKSIPAIGSILVIGLLFILIYAVVGINLFKTSLDFYCSDNQIREQHSCIEKGNIWFVNQENFNNIFNALKTLFVILSTQNWVWLMNLAYFKKLSYSVYFYFISFIIFANFFILNLFVSVIVEKFKSLKEKKNKLFSLTEEEKDWIKVQKIMLKCNPSLKLNEDECSFWQMKIYQLISNIKFELFSVLFILFAILLLAVQYNGANESYNTALQMANYVLTAIFNIELLLKLFVFRKNFFKSRWNLFDFIIIMLCNIVLLMNILEQYNVILNNSKLSTLPGIFRALRILRVLRIIAVYPNLRSLIDTLVYLVPSIVNIGLIMLILFTIYGCVGVNLFGAVPFRDNIHEYQNFRNFPNAVLLLFKVTTGDDWSVIMNELAFHDCRKLEIFLGTEDYKDLNYRILESYYNTIIKGKGEYDATASGEFHNLFVGNSIDEFEYISNFNKNNNKKNAYSQVKENKENNLPNFKSSNDKIENKFQFKNKMQKIKVSKKTYSVVNRKYDHSQKTIENNKNKNIYNKLNEQGLENTNNNYSNNNLISNINHNLFSFYHRSLQSFPNLTISVNNTKIDINNKSLTFIDEFLTNYKQDYFCAMYQEVYCNGDDNITYAMLKEGIGFSCGTDFSYIYFISFVIIGPIFVMNLCVVIVVEGFSESMLENESLLSQSEMDKFISVWVNYDTKFSKLVKPYEMVLILKEINPPLGLNYDRLFVHNTLKSWKNFKMKSKIKKTLQNNIEKFIEESKHKKNNEDVAKISKPYNNKIDENFFNNIKNCFDNESKQNNIKLSSKINNKKNFGINEVELQQLSKSNIKIIGNGYLKDENNQNQNQRFLQSKINFDNSNNENINASNLNRKNSVDCFNRNKTKSLFTKEKKEIIKDGLKIIKKGQNTLNCKNFFFDKNLKFWTFNSEVIRIVDFFGFNSNQSDLNSVISENESNEISKKLSIKEGILNNSGRNFDLYEGLEIHFVDACLSLSKYITSKKHSVMQDSLRTKVVKKITKNLWKNKYNLIPEEFEGRKKNVLSENLSLRILGKIKPKLKNMLENARRNIYLRKLSNEQAEPLL